METLNKILCGIGGFVGICFLAFGLPTIDLTNVSQRDLYPQKQEGIIKMSKVREKEKSKIAFVFMDRKEKIMDIYTINAEGKERENLTNTLNKAECLPSWSPDGEKIIYRVWTENYPEYYEEIISMDRSRKIILHPRISASEMLKSWYDILPELDLQNDTKKYNGYTFQDWNKWLGEHDLLEEVRLDDCTIESLPNKTIWIGNRKYKYNKRDLRRMMEEREISPDGKKRVFSEEGIIYLSNADGRNKKKLTEGIDPSWQPIPR